MFCGSEFRSWQVWQVIAVFNFFCNIWAGMQQHVGTKNSPCVFWPLNVYWMSEEETQQVGTSTCWCSWCSSWCFCTGRLCWNNLNLKQLPHVSVWSAASCLICVVSTGDCSLTIFIAAHVLSQTFCRSVPVSSNLCWSLSQAIWRLTLRSWRFCGATWLQFSDVFSRVWRLFVLCSTSCLDPVDPPLRNFLWE